MSTRRPAVVPPLQAPDTATHLNPKVLLAMSKSGKRDSKKILFFLEEERSPKNLLLEHGQPLFSNGDGSFWSGAHTLMIGTHSYKCNIPSCSDCSGRPSIDPSWQLGRRPAAAAEVEQHGRTGRKCRRNSAEATPRR